MRLLTGIEVTDRAGMHDAAVALKELGPKYVLVKSGHLTSDPECVDLLYDGREFVELPGVSAASKTKILWDNCARLYGLGKPK